MRARAARSISLGREPAGASRLAVLVVVVAAGFLAMHGFLAVSAAAAVPHAPHVSVAHAAFATGDLAAAPGAALPRDPGVHQQAAALPAPDGSSVAGHGLDPGSTGAAGLAAGHPDAGSGPAGPGAPGPVEHHDVVAGCVVALVGVAVLSAVAAQVLRGRTHGRGGPTGVAVGRVRTATVGPVPGLPPPRLTLCVIQV